MMFRHLIGAVLALGLVLAVPTGDAFAQKKNKKKDGDVAPAKDGDKLSAGEYTGTLTSVPGTDRSFGMDVAQQKLVPNGKGPRANYPPTRRPGASCRCRARSGRPR